MRNHVLVHLSALLASTAQYAALDSLVYQNLTSSVLPHVVQLVSTIIQCSVMTANY